ncbi:MAG: hypothetical protein AAFW97_14675 [Pseudomonadota bacterium]
MLIAVAILSVITLAALLFARAHTDADALAGYGYGADDITNTPGAATASGVSAAGSLRPEANPPRFSLGLI